MHECLAVILAPDGPRNEAARTRVVVVLSRAPSMTSPPRDAAGSITNTPPAVSLRRSSFVRRFRGKPRRCTSNRGMRARATHRRNHEGQGRVSIAECDVADGRQHHSTIDQNAIVDADGSHDTRNRA